MKLIEIINEIAETSDLDANVVERVLNEWENICVREFKEGHTIYMGENFGKLVSKLSVHKKDENSPRTPKPAIYNVVFKESTQLKKELKFTD